ncbi:MAG: hypothetical protein K9G60_11545 [Pseudolabrys sp.]|nr:hypothetical protein [Pseudolabrys sp.]
MPDLVAQPQGVIEKMPEPADYSAPPRTMSEGPNPKQMRALIEARVRQGEARRATIGKRRQADGGTLVRKAATHATHAAYLDRGWGLFARYRWENGLSLAAEDIDPRDFVNWLFALQPGLEVTSWRQYRSAALAWVQTLPHTWMEEAAALLEADIGVGADEGRAEQFGRRVGLVRQERAKRFDKNDLLEIIQILPTFSRSVAVPWLKAWLLAGVNTGLRPFEWATTDIEVRSDPSLPHGRQAWLHVVNAEASVGHPSFCYRTLDISNFSDRAFEMIQEMVDRAGQWTIAGEFEMRHSQVAQLLYEVCSVLFPRQRQRYSLYSLRDQFTANMRAVYPPAEVAALVGHISNEPAEHYGRRRIAWFDDEISERPLPMPNILSQMRKRLKWHENRQWVQGLRRAARRRR